MDTVNIKLFVLGELATNCYLIFDGKTKKGFVIDTPPGAQAVKDFTDREKIDILFVILTHAHFDHVEGLNSFPQPFYIHSQDEPFLKEPNLNGSLFFNRPVIIERKPLLLEPGLFTFPPFSLEVLHTPGHTPGSVTLRLGNWLFCGDTIFFDSIGRTDLPLSSQVLLLNSIREKILSLPFDTAIYPGHGPSTTVGREKKHNPFL